MKKVYPTITLNPFGHIHESLIETEDVLKEISYQDTE